MTTFSQGRRRRKRRSSPLVVTSAFARVAVAALLALTVLSAPAGGAVEDRTPVTLGTVGDVRLLGSGPTRLQVGVGVFDVAGEQRRHFGGERSAVGLVELRLGRKLYALGPLLGIQPNASRGLFGYGGLYCDLAFERWLLSPFFTAGGYRRGAGKELGGVFEFQVGGSLLREIGRGAFVGVTFAHLSNAFTRDRNPGAESVLLTTVIPLR